MPKYALVDDSQFPLIRITFTGNSAEDDNFDLYLTEMKAVYEQGSRLAILFDARNAVLPSLKHQKRQASWLTKNEKMLKRQCAGTAYVIDNLAIRLILKTIFSITPQPVPYKVFRYMDEAEEWALSQI